MKETPDVHFCFEKMNITVYFLDNYLLKSSMEQTYIEGDSALSLRTFMLMLSFSSNK